MAYEGEILDSCGLLDLDLRKVSVVSVSGSGPNACGHLILYMPAGGGYYFHVAGGRAFPRYMTEKGFERYLQENSKREFRRVSFTLPNPAAAEKRLEELLSRKWLWLLLPRNCVVFCETVIQAGGINWGSLSDCPVLATDVPVSELNRFMNSLEAEIRGLYGAPF